MLPPQTALEKLDLANDDARARLLKRLEKGLDKPVGYMLPLEHNGELWRTSSWPLRRDEVFLVAGDSPAGLRLPLEALPEDETIDSEARQSQQDRYDQTGTLPSYAALQQPVTNKNSNDSVAPYEIRTTLCLSLIHI